MTAYPAIEAFFDEAAFTVTGLVSDPATRRGAMPVPGRRRRPTSASATSLSMTA